MKIPKFLPLLLSIMLLSMSFNDEIIDRMGVKGPLKFDNTNFELAWSSHPRKNYYIQEYLPKGENVDSFNQMLTLNVFTIDMEIKDAAAYKVKELEERKKTDAVCNYSVMENTDTKEIIIDFIVSDETEKPIVEFNIYRYKQINSAGNKKAILVYFYSKRAYDKQIIPFLKNLEKDRPEYLKKMMSIPIPTITISDTP